MKKMVSILVLVLLLVPVVFAAEVSEITEPLNKIYDLVKAVISVIAIIAITIAGARFMFSGDNIQAREGAKSMISYAVIGLVIVWVAPLLVNYLSV